MRLLLIEDNGETAALIAASLRARDHQLTLCADGASALTAAGQQQFDVIIIDRMLPDGDGMALIASLRAAGQRGATLLLTALGSEEDRVAGLEAGADDYLVKPFSMAELAARVSALGRRHAGGPTIIAIADLVVDRLARRVTRGGTPIELQPRELELLEYLMLASPSIVTRMMLLERVWHFHFDPGTNIVESHISRLRGKIDRGNDLPLIHTVRGEGYAIHAP